MPDTEQLIRKTQELAFLARVAELLTSLNLDDVLSNTLHLLTDTVDAERGSFFLLDDEGRATQRYITRRNLPPEHSFQVVGQVLESGLAGWVYRHQQGTIVEDTRTDKRWVSFPDDTSPVRSVLCVPFMSEGHIHGIMTLEHAEAGHFTEDDLRLAMTVANQSTVVIRNAQLFDQVETHERQLRAVLQSIAEPLFTISPQGRIQLVNPATLKLIGESEAAVIGRSLDELVAANPLFGEVAAQMGGGARRFEIRDAPTKRDYVVQVASWLEGDMHDLGHVIVLNDITTLKNLTRLKSQMLQMASHDLKNPLGVILGYAEMMLMDIPQDDELHEFAEGIARTSERMLEMVSDLLDLERIEGSAEAHETFSPAMLLDPILTEEELNASQQHQSLRREIAPDLPDLVGDPAQIREAFGNLVSNAIKYTPEHGLITVRASADGQRFHFSVEDTGYGIPEDLQDRIFERFYRAKQPGAEEISGTGLGLSLVKAVIERHGGQVWFKSTAGEGSTFGFWLPLPDATGDS